MKRIQVLFAGALAMLCACQPSKQSNRYTVTGELEDSAHHGKKVYMVCLDGNKVIDSTLVEGKKFVFAGEVDTASLCRIDVTPSAFAAFILESGDVKIDMKTHVNPSGTPLNEEYQKVIREQDSVYTDASRKHKELGEKYTDAKGLQEARQKLVEEIRASLEARSREFYAVHNNDAVGYALVGSVFMRDLDADTRLQIMSTFGPWLKSREMVQKAIAEAEALKKTAEGMPFTDIKGKDAEGNPVALSDYVGKGNYVLLDMWASWCGPCKSEIPNLLKLHNRYKDKGLTVLGLFVWDKEENLKKAVAEEGIVWSQIIDTDMSAQNLYGVSGIPHIILFSPEGTILKRYLRGQDMIDAVDEVMGKK